MKRYLYRQLCCLTFALFSSPFLASADTNLSGTIASNQTLTASSSPYFIFNQVTIPVGVTLSVDPGVIIKFGQNGGFVVSGTFKSKGTTADPVYLTSYGDDGVGGDSGNDGYGTGPQGWSGFVFNDGSSGSFEQTTVEYGGLGNSAALNNIGGNITISEGLIISAKGSSALVQDFGTTTVTSTEFSNNSLSTFIFKGGVGIIDTSNIHDNKGGVLVVKNAKVNVQNSTFTNNQSDLAVIIYPATFTHAGNHATGNWINGFYVTGSVQSDTELTNDNDIPYIPISLSVASNVTLSIDPSVLVKFFANASVSVGGTLSALGTLEHPITFTSTYDKPSGELFNAYPDSPSANRWGYIGVQNGGNITATHIEVAYGGGNGVSTGAIVNQGGQVHISDTYFHDNTVSVYTASGDTEIVHSRFLTPDNNKAAYFDGGNLSVHTSSFEGVNGSDRYSSSASIQTRYSVLDSVDATNNWWGNATGPFNPSNLNGLGITVNNKVNFTPWLTSNPFATSSATTTNITKPVIIIPGVLGTEIFKGSEKLWLNIGHTVTDIGDQFMDSLQFGADLLPTDTGLSTGDVIRTEGPSAFKFNYTGSLIKEFEGQGYELNKNLFLFPYDWRYGINDANVNALAQKIEDIRTQTGKDKVDVVAHSTGGLLVKKYVIEHISDSHIDKAVFVGVPNAGAPKAIKVLLQGDGFGDPFLSDGEMKKISKNLPVVYDLSPSKQYYDTKGSFVRVINRSLLYSTTHDLSFGESKSFLNDNGLNAQAITNAENLHTSSFDNFDLRIAGINLYNIVGCKAGSIGKVIQTNTQGLFNTQTTYDLQYTPGDGTVPLESATNLPVDQTAKYYALSADHSQMMSQDGIRQQITNIITGSNLAVGNKITQDISRCGLNGKAISIFSPLRIDIVDQAGNHSGLDADGNVFNNIPNASFSVFGEHKAAYLPTGDGQMYTVSLNGTGNGTFTLKDSDIVNNQIIQTNLFSDIPVTPALIGKLDLQNSVLLLNSTNTGTSTTVYPDEGSKTLSELLVILSQEIQNLLVKDKLKQNLLKQVENIKAKIVKKREKDATIISNFQTKLSNQVTKGKVDVVSIDDISTILNGFEAQIERVSLDQETLSILQIKIQALNIKQDQKNLLIKQISKMMDKQRVTKTLSNFVAIITNKNSGGKINDTDARSLLDLLSQVEGII